MSRSHPALKAFAPDDYQVSNTRFQAGTPPKWGRAAGFPAYSRQHSFGNGARSLPSVLLVGGISYHFGKFIRLDTGMVWLSRRARGAHRGWASSVRKRRSESRRVGEDVCWNE